MEAQGEHAAPHRGAALGEAYISGALSSVGEGAVGRLFYDSARAERAAESQADVGREAALRLYELLGEIVGEAGLTAYVPHRHTDPVAAPDLAPQTVDEVDRRRVASARILVAYAGLPSFGVGIEVEIARQHGVPVILVVERDRPVSRMLLGSPAVSEVVRFSDLTELRTALRGAIQRVEGKRREAAGREPDDETVVRRFLRTLADARRLPPGELGGLLRLAGLEGGVADEVRDAVAKDSLFAAGLRDLVGRHGLRGAELGLFLRRHVLGRAVSAAERRRLAPVLARLGLAGADDAAVAQWLVTELVVPPSRALQLQLFGLGADE